MSKIFHIASGYALEALKLYFSPLRRFSSQATNHHNTSAKWRDNSASLNLNAEGEERRIRALDELAATTDPLTGLRNRGWLAREMESLIEGAKSGGYSFALIFIDLDRFNVVNARLGHAGGDEVLKSVAESILSHPQLDALARLGADEFVAVSLPIADPDRGIVLAEELLELARKPITVSQVELRMTASIGVVFCPRDGKDLNTLLRRADAAMYLAKRSGGNQARLFDLEMERENVLDGKTEAVRAAWTEKQLVLHYQPEISLVTDSVLAAVAVPIWPEGEAKNISMAELLSSIELAGLSGAVADWILNEACDQVAKFHKTGFDALRAVVEVPAQASAANEFVSSVDNALARSGLAARFLELVVYESNFIPDSDLGQRLRALREKGVRLSIDDYGTGYLARKGIPPLGASGIRIASASLGGNGKSAIRLGKIMESRIRFCHSFGLEVTATGVETLPILNALKRYGCDNVQGSVFSKPLQARDFLNFVDGVADKSILSQSRRKAIRAVG